MTDHGLLFKSELIRAFLAGRKTMTRRLVTRGTVVGADGKRFSEATWCDLHFDGASSVTAPLSVPVTYRGRPDETKGVRVDVLPLWRVGDTVWARETWAAAYQRGCWGTIFRADSAFEQGARKHEKGPYYEPDELPTCVKWRSPIFLPQWASRLRFDVTEARIERLQDITEADAKAEGIPFNGTWHLGGLHPIKGVPQSWPTAKKAFEKGWDVINGARASWASNPWVVVIGLARRS